MSEYYLADQRAEERAKARELEKKKQKPAKSSQDVKVTLLGDFHFPSSEAHGCDPYNNAPGKPSQDPWKHRRDRR